MRRLSHKNILTLHEVHETKHSIYLVLEALKGGELLKKIKEKQFLNEEEIINVLRNFLEALAHIHENQIMHRDLKPENLLLRDDNDVSEIVIADFGLATEIDLPINEILFKRCGTPGFVAPEILNYKDGQEGFYDEKCDVFSAGVIFHILLTGKKAFTGNDYKEILRANKACNIDYNSELYKNVSPKGFFIIFLYSMHKNSLLIHSLNPIFIALDLLKKLMIPDPRFRPSAKQSLNHSFFLNIPSNSLDSPLKLHITYSSGFSLANNPLELSKESLGSLSLVTRKPILNGRVDTIDKLSQNNLNSTGSIDTAGCLTPKQKQTSKFSHISQGVGAGDSPMRKAAMGMPYFQSDLHKKMIINNMNQKENEEEKK